MKEKKLAITISFSRIVVVLQFIEYYTDNSIYNIITKYIIVAYIVLVPTNYLLLHLTLTLISFAFNLFVYMYLPLDSRFLTHT